MSSASVLTVNPGSRSLKLRLLDGGDSVVAELDIQHPAEEAGRELDRFLGAAPEPDAAGIRIVHGGPDLTVPVLLDSALLERLDAVTPLAPLHNPPALRAARELQRRRPDLPLVGCFDTGFHATMPAAAATYPVPWRWTSEWGVRRYGFHGLNHAYVARRASELLGLRRSRRLVSCHLGGGASLAAIVEGRSVDTTMGFTPMEGVMMATRSGSIDPGLMLWVEREHGLSPAELERALDRDSGLLGVSGVSSDMREVLAAAAGGHSRAQLAIDVYVHRLRSAAGAMAASAGGLDALVFTAGIGEHAASIRAATCAGLEHLGVELDSSANDHAEPDSDVAAPGSPVRVLVIRAREDLELAAQTRRVVEKAAHRGA